MNDVERIGEQFDGVMAVVGAARQILADGRAVDLAGLEGRVVTLCEKVRTLPEQHAALYRPRLVALLDELDRLTAELEAQHQLVARELGSLVTRKHAVRAYGKSRGTP